MVKSAVASAAAIATATISPTVDASMVATPTAPMPTATAAATAAARPSSETEDRGLASSNVDADDEQSPGEDTTGSTTDNTASTAAATATTADGGTPVVAENGSAANLANNDEVDIAAAGVGYDADREGGGGEDQRRQKTQLPGAAAGDVADYDGDAEGVGGGKNGSRQGVVAAAAATTTVTGCAVGGPAVALSASGRPILQVKKTSSVMDLIREKEEAAKVAKNKSGERSESMASLSPSFAAVRRRKQVDTRVWSGAGTAAPGPIPTFSQPPTANNMPKVTTQDDADGETSGGAEAGAESEGTGQREPWANRAPVAVSTGSPLSPSMGAARTRSGRGGLWGGEEAAGDDTSDASSIAATPAAVARGMLSSKTEATASSSAPVLSTSTLPSLWPPSPAAAQPRNNGMASSTTLFRTAPTGSRLLAHMGSIEKKGEVAFQSSTPASWSPRDGWLTSARAAAATSTGFSSSVASRIGSFQKGGVAAKVLSPGSRSPNGDSSAPTQTRVGAKAGAGAAAGSSVSVRVGNLQKGAPAAQPSTAVFASPDMAFSAPAGSSILARIGSLEKRATTNESLTSVSTPTDKGSPATTVAAASARSASSSIARMGSYEKAGAAFSGSTGRKSGGSKQEFVSTGGRNVMGRVGSFEKEAASNKSATWTGTSKTFGSMGGGGGSVIGRIGSFEKEAASRRNGGFGGSQNFVSGSSATRNSGGRGGGKSDGSLVSALAMKVGGELGRIAPAERSTPPKPNRGPIGGPFDEEEVSCCSACRVPLFFMRAVHRAMSAYLKFKKIPPFSMF